MEERRPSELATRAGKTRVAVVGGGIAGLVAAWDCARIGMPVTLFDADERLGGSIQTAMLDGIPLDLVADALPLGATPLAALLEDLGLSDRLDPAATEGVAIAVPAPTDGRPDAVRVVTMPENLAGIPANPWGDPVRRLVGGRGVWRAYLDRLRPPLTIGRQRSLGELVRVRMGARIRDRLVAPITTGLYGVDPDLVDVDVAVPGLNATLTRVGSLGGAVAQLAAERPAVARATLGGGLGALVAALVERLRDLDVDIRTGTAVTELQRDDRGWTVRHVRTQDAPAPRSADTGAPTDSDPATGTPAPRSADTAPAETDTVVADVVILASGAASARALLAPLDTAVDAPSASVRDVVTLVMDAPAPPARDRPAIIVPLAGSVDALSLVDVTAMWPSVASVAGPGRRVFRVSLAADGPAPRVDEPLGSVDPVSPDRAAAVRALTARAERAVTALVDDLPAGVSRGHARVVAHRRVGLAVPASALGHAARAAEARAAIARLDGVWAVGAWLSGSGIAAVVADTLDEIEHVRRATLFGDH